VTLYRGLALIFITCLTACTVPVEVVRIVESPPEDVAPRVNLDAVQFFPQEDYQCGPAALATVLDFAGVAVSPEQLVEQVYIPSRHGSLQLEMLAATRRQERIPYLLDTTLEALVREVAAGLPVLVFQNLGLSWWPQWHYAVVVGFDLEAGTILLRSGLERNYSISLALFQRTWRRTDNWAFLVLSPGQLPVTATPLRYLESVLAMEQLPGGFTLAEQGYRAALDRWPDSPLFPTALGNLYYQADQLEEARSQFQRLVRDHPASADGHNNLAWVLLRLGQYAQAQDHALRAVSLGGPRLADYQETLQSIEQQSISTR